jgi:aryl-alcohol dehydrogenase-like predicted oxidoreductase
MSTPMARTALGHTGLVVSRIAYGTWQFSGAWGRLDESKAMDAVACAREIGINFFDTAPGYGFGIAERLLGRALRDELRTDRSALVLATKGGVRLDGDRLVRDGSPEWIRAGIHDSLESLGVDHIDLYQVHWPDPSTPMEQTAEALAQAVDDGLIGHVGVSNFTVEQMADFASVLPVETLQSPYHLFRRAIEHDVLPYARAEKMGVLAYGPLAHGLLGGSMTANTTFADDDWRAQSSAFSGQTFVTNLQAVDEFRQLATTWGATVSQLAVAWVLAQPGVDVAIVGSTNAAHLAESAGVANLDLTPECLHQIERIISSAVQIEGASPEGYG